MNKELTEKLYQNYPKVFAKKIPIWVGDGWYDLIDTMCALIEDYTTYNIPEEAQCQYHATTIKEKYGSLRFYMSHETDYIDGVISLAENQSESICEHCGEKGILRDINSWYSTLCDKHYQERLDEKKAR